MSLSRSPFLRLLSFKMPQHPLKVEVQIKHQPLHFVFTLLLYTPFHHTPFFSTAGSKRHPSPTASSAAPRATPPSEPQAPPARFSATSPQGLLPAPPAPRGPDPTATPYGRSTGRSPLLAGGGVAVVDPKACTAF